MRSAQTFVEIDTLLIKIVEELIGFLLCVVDRLWIVLDFERAYENEKSLMRDNESLIQIGKNLHPFNVQLLTLERNGLQLRLEPLDCEGILSREFGFMVFEVVGEKMEEDAAANEGERCH